MIRDKVRPGLYCYKCGGNHMSGDCGRHKNKLPLETPSHNGKYIGPVPVREVPWGVCGTDLKLKVSDSHTIPTNYKLVCKNPECKKPFETINKQRAYCSNPCKHRVSHKRNHRSDRKRKKKTDRLTFTKWG